MKQRLRDFGYNFIQNNNTRSNSIVVFVAIVILAYWLTCTGKAEGVNVVYNNRHLWKSNELCDWCSNGWWFITMPWCNITGWITKWGWIPAIIYWFVARRDELGRILEGAWEKTVVDRGGVQDLPDQPPPGNAPQPDSPLQRMRHRGFNLGQFLRYDFASNLVSDLLTNLVMNWRRA